MVAPFIRGIGRLASGFDFPPAPRFRPRLRITQDIAQPVEPPAGLFPVRRARPAPDPQDIQFLNPRLGAPVPTPRERAQRVAVSAFDPRLRREVPFDEPEFFREVSPPTAHSVATERYTDVLNPIVPGRTPAQVRYMPLPSSEVDRISLYASEEPVAAILDAAQALDDAANPEQFAVALQAVRAVRRGVPEGDEIESMMSVIDRRVMSRARELGIPEDVIEALPTISNAARPRGLYKESQELAEKGFNAQQQNAWPFLKKIRSTVRGFKKAKPGVSKIVDEDSVRSILSMLVGPGGGQIARMVRSGDIGMAEARRLHDEAVDAYILLSQNSAVKTIRGKGMRALQTPNFARMSDEAKTEVYAFAMQSADSADEVAMISSAWRADITNPNYLDELELMEGHAVERLSSYARVTPWTGKGTPRAKIDEESIESANRAIREDETRRAMNDDTRPAFPDDDIDPEETIVNAFLTEDGKVVERLAEGQRWAKDADGNRIPVTLGGARRTMIDRSLSTPPEQPSVPLGQGAMAPPNPRNGGPGAYNSRTVDNAQQADITISIAANRATGGEILTERAALGAATVRRGVNKRGQDAWVSEFGKDGQYGRVTAIEKIDHLSADIDSHVDSIVAQLNRVAATQGRPVIINGAGNGLASLPSQAEADAFARHLIKRIVENPNRSFDIDYLVTGGQNGYDIALAKAAKAYGIRVRINPAYTSKGSIMLQDPDDIENMIFMSPQEYVRNHKLDTAEVGASYGKTQPSASASTSQSSFSASPMRMPMNFKDGDRGLRMAPGNEGKSTMDLILEGSRTGTTRSSLAQFNKADGTPLQVGDVVEFTDRSGRTAKVEITKAPYQLPQATDAIRRRWSELEGWDPAMYDRYAGQWQIQYRLLGS